MRDSRPIPLCALVGRRPIPYVRAVAPNAVFRPALAPRGDGEPMGRSGLFILIVIVLVAVAAFFFLSSRQETASTDGAATTTATTDGAAGGGEVYPYGIPAGEQTAAPPGEGAPAPANP